MDRRERIPPRSPNALLVAIQAALDAKQANIWTALPAIASKFNAAKVTVSAQPTIQAQVHQPSGAWLDVTLPLCVDCPVMFPGGGGFALTFPIEDNDEGVLVFASRCIDSWWQNGGVQKQAELRMHDLSDGFFFPSGLSNPKTSLLTGGVSATGPQFRSNDGLTSVTLDGNLRRCLIAAPGGLWVNGVRVNVP